MDEAKEPIALLTFKRRNVLELWLEGTLETALPGSFDKADKYNFQAKVYNEGSKFGINNGRVSKLFVWKNDFTGKESYRITIASYDRGWDTQPTDETDKAAVQSIIDALEETPR